MDVWGCVTYAQPDLASHAEPRARYALQFGFYELDHRHPSCTAPLPAEVQAVNITELERQGANRLKGPWY